MRVTVEDGRLRAIEAHPGNAATPEGVCLKGLSYIERVSHPERLLHPLQRTPDGGFEPHFLGSGPRPDHRRTRECARHPRPAERLLLRSQRHQGSDEPGGDRLLAVVRRLHHDLWRSLLAGRARGDTAHPRGQQAQRPLGPRQRPPHHLLGQESGRDQPPPDAIRRAGRGARGEGGRHRSAADAVGGRRRAAGADPSRDRWRASPWYRPSFDREGCH